MNGVRVVIELDAGAVDGQMCSFIAQHYYTQNALVDFSNWEIDSQC